MWRSWGAARSAQAKANAKPTARARARRRKAKAKAWARKKQGRTLCDLSGPRKTGTQSGPVSRPGIVRFFCFLEVVSILCVMYVSRHPESNYICTTYYIPRNGKDASVLELGFGSRNENRKCFKWTQTVWTVSNHIKHISSYNVMFWFSWCYRRRNGNIQKYCYDFDICLHLLLRFFSLPRRCAPRSLSF